jgi:hypothetical protein
MLAQMIQMNQRRTGFSARPFVGASRSRKIEQRDSDRAPAEYTAARRQSERTGGEQKQGGQEPTADVEGHGGRIVRDQISMLRGHCWT